MIILTSKWQDRTHSRREWSSRCEACSASSETTSRSTVAIAWSLEHQRRCRTVRGAPVRWEQDGIDVGVVTPALGIELAQ